MTNELWILSVLALNVALAELLARHTPLRVLGTALLVIVTTAVCANVGLVPTVTQGSAVYDAIFDPLAYLAIFLLLLQVNLAQVRRAGAATIFLFLVGAAGTVLGVVAGMALIDGASHLGEHSVALGGMFVGTYIGGSINFNALALEYGVTKEPVLLAAANAVDSGMTTIWMAVGIVAPKLLRRLFKRPYATTVSADRALRDRPDDTSVPRDLDSESVGPLDLAFCLALATLGLVTARALATWFANTWGVAVPMVLVLTVLALVLAQTPLAARLRGARALGMFGVYLFLAVIGALCDVGALRASGELGLWITVLVAVTLVVHGLAVFGTAALLRLDFDAAAVASQANIGGGTTALALARSLDRPDLVVPAILMGSLGTALGTFLGVWTIERLL